MAKRDGMDRFDPQIEKFKGQLSTLESAIGAYIVGRRLGWKVLYLVHEKRTIRKWEEILAIRFRDELPADQIQSYLGADGKPFKTRAGGCLSSGI